MTRSWAYNRFGVLMGTSWRASGPRWPSLREDVLPMITLFPSQGDFCATANYRIKSSQFHACVVCRKLPMCLGVLLVPFGVPRADLFAECGLRRDTTPKALTTQMAEFNLSHV